MTITKIENEAHKKKKSFYETMCHILNSSGYSKALKGKIKGFVNIIEELRDKKNIDASELLWLLLEKTGYLKWIGDDKSENLMELVNSSEERTLAALLIQPPFSAQQMRHLKTALSP